MPALNPGIDAPEITLTSTSDETFVLSEALKRGPAVLAFFKISCPTCQYALPYLQRIYQAHKTEPITFVGISQDDLKSTESFMKQYDVTFPVLLDDPKRYRASNDYGLTNVPTTFLVRPNGTIEVSTVGWSRADIEDLNSRLAMKSPDQNLISVFKPGEQVAEFKAG
jgi:peroxiredoxin